MTDRFADTLVASDLGAFTLAEVEVTLNPDAQEEHAGSNSPFPVAQGDRAAGHDDPGLTSKAQLVVSECALRVLRAGVIDNCAVEPYVPGSREVR
ncbi:hypothetical protein BKA15_002412 [Microlunatus parietis]|uniref:Uncharacterized protein n=1 Tax=Microlunatus parietis TaxID=682979 RepID=A0A7Y9LBQ2_9ACTN|nr:hypothetical protein [Microlunatus parietis]